MSAEIAKLPGIGTQRREIFAAVAREGPSCARSAVSPQSFCATPRAAISRNGVVRSPRAFPAYRLFREGGWTALARSRLWRPGLPVTLNFFFEEMVRRNFSFGMYPGLSAGAYAAIHKHGSDTQKETYLPRWSTALVGTMCLTEPQCGTDLGLVSNAGPKPTDRDGIYQITGTKIFISPASMIDRNIIHLVLARLPDAPSGTRGISLFIVPKFLVKGRRLGRRPERRALRRDRAQDGDQGLRHLHHQFRRAEGYLVGAPHAGMRAMFTMMNAARLGVGLQGLAVGETASNRPAPMPTNAWRGRALTVRNFQRSRPIR